MNLEAPIAALRRGDPDRWAMARLAPAPARPRLVTLYALNLELARTALSAREPMIAEMRVQWWVDRLAALADGPPPPHELLSPLWEAWGTEAAGLADLAEARRRDAERQPFADVAEVAAYAAATGGALMRHAAGVIAPEAAPVAVDQGQGAGLAAWLRAEPALAAWNLGFARPDHDLRRDAARLGLEALARAAARRALVPRAAAPVFHAGAGARRMLGRVAAGEAMRAPSPFERRAALAWLAMTGRWWDGR